MPVLVEPKEEETFIDFFSIFEWILLIAVVVICCLVCCTLFCWRRHKIDKAKKEADAHNLSAVVLDEDGLEMASAKKRPVGSLDFANSGRQMSDPASTGTPVGTYKNNEVDFASALATVGNAKSQNSLFKSQSDETENDPNTYSNDFL